MRTFRIAEIRCLTAINRLKYSHNLSLYTSLNNECQISQISHCYATHVMPNVRLFLEQVDEWARPRYAVHMQAKVGHDNLLRMVR